MEITATFLNALRFLLRVNGLLIHKNLLKARNYPHILHTLCRPSAAYFKFKLALPQQLTTNMANQQLVCSQEGQILT